MRNLSGIQISSMKLLSTRKTIGLIKLMLETMTFYGTQTHREMKTALALAGTIRTWEFQKEGN